MSDSEDDLNVDLSQWKTRTVNVAPEPPAPAPRTFASINAPTTAPPTTNGLDDDDDFDIDAIIEGIADPDDALQSKAPTPSPPPPSATTTRRPRQTVQVVITRDPNFNPNDYIDCTYGANIVRRVLKEITKNENVYYNVEFVDRHTEQVSTFHYYCLDTTRRHLELCLASYNPVSLLEASPTSRFTLCCHVLLLCSLYRTYIEIVELDLSLLLTLVQPRLQPN